MQLQCTPSQEPVSAEERAALLSILPTSGKERPAIHAQAVALYARESMPKRKDGQDDEDAKGQDAIPYQLDACRRYAARRIPAPIRYELQDGKTGLSAQRADYQRLLALAEAGQISHVVLFKFDRIGRDDAEFTRAMRRLMALGIEVHDTTQGLMTPQMVGFHAMVTNYEVRAISARVGEKLAFLAKGGHHVGRPMLGYRRTLKPGVLEIDPVSGPVMAEAYRKYAAGEMGMRALTEWVNGQLGLNWLPANFSKVLKNPWYKGIYVSQKRRNSKIDGNYARPREEWQFARHQAPLVDEATWDAVQARLALMGNVGQERKHGAKYLLAGLVWCNRCGLRMSGHVNTPNRPGTYTEYKCNVCSQSRSQRRVEGIVRRLLEAVPIGEQVDAALHATGEEDHSAVVAELAEVDQRLHALTQRRVNLTAKFADGEIDGSDYAATLAQTDQERAELRQRRDALERRVQAGRMESAGAEKAAAWLREQRSWTAALDHLTPEELRAAYRECVRRIVLGWDAQTLTVWWTAPIARLLGRESDTVVVPAGRRDTAIVRLVGEDTSGAVLP
jgi:DNA invertase Pin-like site-specific DNA recombinase